MAQAAYCSQCGTNVYVTPDGRCPQGHGPEFLSNYYETDEPGAAQAPVQEPVQYAPPAYPPGQVNPVQPPKKKNTVLIVVLVILALLVLCGVGAGVAMCQLANNATDVLETAIESSDGVVVPPAGDVSTDSGTQGPDTTPALQPGVVRVTLGWDQSADMDLEIWSPDGEDFITSAGGENEDVFNGNEGREYFDFSGDYSSGEWVVSVFFADSNEGPDSAIATVTVYKADGSTETRSHEVWWDPGQDQWHAFSIDAATGNITDINEFYAQ